MGVSGLHRAVSEFLQALDGEGDIARVDDLIRRELADHPQRGRWLDGGLATAARNGDVEMTRLLLSHGARPGAQERRNGECPAHQAAAGGHVAVLRALGEADPQCLSLLNQQGQAPVFAAARHFLDCGDAEALRWLLEQHPRGSVGRETSLGLLGATRGSTALLEWLQRAATLPNILRLQEVEGRLLACEAATHGHANVLRWLHANDPEALAHRDATGWSCVHIAASGQSPAAREVLRSLLDLDPGLGSQVTTEGQSPASIAVLNDHVAALVELDAHAVDLACGDRSASSPLALARARGARECERFLEARDRHWRLERDAGRGEPDTGVDPGL